MQQLNLMKFLTTSKTYQVSNSPTQIQFYSSMKERIESLCSKTGCPQSVGAPKKHEFYESCIEVQKTQVYSQEGWYKNPKFLR